MKTRVKISKFTQKHKALLGYFRRQSFASNIFGSEPIANHNIALFLFDYKIWLNQWKNIIQHWSSCLPIINRSCELLFACPSIARVFRATKRVLEPNNKLFVTTGDLKYGMPLKSIAVFALFCMTYIDAAFSINKSSEISDFSNRMISLKLNNFSHEFPFVNSSIAFNEQEIHGERLSEKTHKLGCDSLTSSGNLERMSRRACPASLEVIKVTELVLNECAARLGVSLRQTEDTLTRSMLEATAAFINSTGGVNGDNPTEMTREDVNLVVRTLLNNNAYTIADNIEGQDKFGTAPIRRAYWAMCSTNLTSDLENIDGFVNADQYPSTNRALESEWGSVGNVRFLVSSIGSVTPNQSNLNANVYNCFITGAEAYASVHQDQYSATFIYRPPIYDGPLALNASVGYKFAQVPRLLNDQWLLNLRSTLAA